VKKVISVLLMCLVSNGLWASVEFPGRDRYPGVKYIEIEDLYNQRNNVVIIDARSHYEYETLRIKNAKFVPVTLTPSKFEVAIRKIVNDSPGKKLVFYCNGHTCMKSYKAAARATTYLKLDNIYSFDAGIFDWARKYPREAFLLGKELDDVSKLKSKAEFKKHLMPAEKFIKTADDTVMVLDIRDRLERDGFYIFSGYEESISLSDKDRKKLDDFMKNVLKSHKTLYVYDMVGKQVRWFQYYIESKGIKNYYFMEGGGEAFFKIPLNKLLD